MTRSLLCTIPVNWRRASLKVTALLMMGGLSACSHKASTVQVDSELRQAVAQKIMIDIRYFCESAPAPEEPCEQGVTQLPEELAKVVSDTGLGGIILFAENIQSKSQIVRLNHELQQAGLSSNAGHPLFISVDQEGGRVVRTPPEMATTLSGNMAIGATYARHGTEFATQTGILLGKEVKAMGFNINHAPDVDVNVNPDNPVINVRAFGEDANTVAKLGLAQMNGLQSEGVLATLKHFPGHGDTSVDSHTGLPRVEHDRDTIEQVDLKPFAHAIEQGSPAMVMTAHIQYPQLDDSTLTTKDGSEVIRPATLSRAILTDLLREKMGFKGLIATDAMDMAGISHFFEPTQAVIETFKAGADLALMPVKIRHPGELHKVETLIDAVVNAVHRGELDRQEVLASAKRIVQTKQQYQLAEQARQPLSVKVAQAEAVLASAKHRQTEQALADAAITQVRNQNNALPLPDSAHQIHLIMPDKAKCVALSQHLQTYSNNAVTCTSLRSYNATDAIRAIRLADSVVMANISPRQSAVERGGMDNLTQTRLQALNYNDQQKILPELIQIAKDKGKPVTFISLRAPYDIERIADQADAVLASFAYNVYFKQDQQGRLLAMSPIFDALARTLLGQLEPQGQLPVTLGNH
ncbi:Beta-N-acetylhexosaminidase [Saliniradius amylolyticus]|uniref:beta-N-acetylhexosaminidase n=1 Tax=Saliniradius amylolyticus TaxID=2183582 RepID=A0A2S2E7A0_9ALTE|nr:glycoside hydrolase family 3 protein [Saliniradius amylolyticus]AWL13110.1 Beta-N-acetylhexosaminidase [Saliniradius amylolyticus]